MAQRWDLGSWNENVAVADRIQILERGDDHDIERNQVVKRRNDQRGVDDHPAGANSGRGLGPKGSTAIVSVFAMLSSALFPLAEFNHRPTE